MNDFQRRVRDNADCPFCMARPGTWCNTASGKLATDLHSGRVTVYMAIEDATRALRTFHSAMTEAGLR